MSSGSAVRLQDDKTGDYYRANDVQPLTAAVDRSGTANTSASVLAPVNASRKGLTVQNVGANNIGINEIGGTAAIGSAGTYTVSPGGSFKVSTNRAISVIAATGATAYTATEF